MTCYLAHGRQQFVVVLVQFLLRLSYFSKDFKGEFTSQSNKIQGHLRTSYERGTLDKHIQDYVFGLPTLMTNNSFTYVIRRLALRSLSCHIVQTVVKSWSLINGFVHFYEVGRVGESWKSIIIRKGPYGPLSKFPIIVQSLNMS